MFSNLTRFFFVTLVCAFLSAQALASDYGTETVYTSKKPKVQKFDNLFSIRLLTNYSYVAFASSQYDDGTLESNRPVDIGLGLGLSDFTVDFKYSLPFTAGSGKRRSAGFDTGLDFFPRNLWIQAKYRRFSGLSLANEKSSSAVDTTEGALRYNVDLRQSDMYLSVLWVKTGKDQFSVRAPYFLDRIQTESAGSLIFGAKFQSSSTVDRAGVIDFYSKERDIYTTWAHGGYSYTWVFEHNLFVNAWAVGGLAIGSVGSGSFGFFPEFNGKLALGQWHQDWSWNVVPQITYSPSVYGDHVEQRLLGSFEVLVVKRF